MQALTPLLFSMLFPRFSTKNSTQDTYDSQAGYAHLEQHDSLIQNAFEEGYPIQNSPTSPKHKSARRHNSMGPSTSSGHKTSRRSLPARPASSASLVSSSSSTAINSEADLDVNNTATTVVLQQRKTKKHLSLDTAAYRATYPSLDGLGDTGSRPSSMEWFGPFVVDSPQQQYQTPSRSSSSSSSKSSRLRKSIIAEPSMPTSRMSTSSVCSLASDVSSSSSTTSSVREPLTPTTRSPNYRSVVKDHSQKRGKKAVVEDLCLSPASTNFFHEDQGQKQDEVVIAGLGISAARSERQLAH